MASKRSGSSRREFLRTTLSGVAAGGIAPYFLATRTWGDTTAAAPSDRVTFGAIGVGSRAQELVNQAVKLGPIAAMADVDSGHLGDTAARIAQQQESAPATFKEYERVLERPDIDAVIIGTPDHWHSRIAIEALQAGKDVYCEKPLTLTIDEGKQIIKALEQTDRVMQVGTQQRSMEQFVKAVALARAGRLGTVEKVTVGIDRAPYSEAIPTATPPSGLDWNLWLGQCPEREYRFGPKVKKWTKERAGGDGGDDASNCHYEFRWWYDFSGGKLTDWGAHHIDICQWLINQNGIGQGPTRVTPLVIEHPVEFDAEGNPKQADRYNVATKYEFRLDFPGPIEVLVSSETRNGLLVEGSNGRLFVNRKVFEGKPVDELRDNPLPEGALEELRGAGMPWDHMEAFVHCVKTRAKPVSDVWTHHRAVTSGHLCAIAGRLNRPVEWDPQRETILGDPVAEAMQRREQRKGFELPAV